MTFVQKNKNELGSVELLIIIIIIALLAVVGWFVIQKHNHPTTLLKTDASSTQTASSPLSSSNRYWIINATTLNDVVVNASARSVLLNATIFVSGSSTKQLIQQTKGLNLIPTESFTSEASLASALSNKTIKTGTKAILYDNEDWSLTPKKEQANPVLYYKNAASLVHAAGYIFIGTPVSKIDPQIDIQIAPYVDVLDIQSQYDQSVSSIYASHVNPIAEAARQANSKIIILSGLSTNPPRGVPTPQQLVSDAQAVSANVQGYWLNIPSPGTACPKCNSPEPEIGIQFLASLGSK